ncbi:HpcH/HpaI aldolase/citrate lyase family protein [Sphingobium abikonense]|jgi:citrate lyase subunit beta/citryl-CoA lyase|uniref:HpcH/HpaI aldolase/citrate lyase family protein n=1 Tax=Sphingobium abikonense TaxID=86193 RepID=UPI003515A698
MRMRSLLFVPGDRPERFAKAADSGADAIILDLEDSVAPKAKDKARTAVADYLATPSPILRLVRINPLDSGMLTDDLACLTGCDGVMLPKSESAKTVGALAARLAPDVKILPIATETPRAVFGLASYGEVSDRLCGLTWGVEDLPAAIGAVSSRRDDGRYTNPYQMARNLTLFGAHAAGVAAIETVYPAIRDDVGLEAYAARGAYDGFTGMMALHPVQVPIINAAFTPSAEQVKHARAVIDAFAQSPDAGVLLLDGRMIDAPHLLQARKLLARAGLD